MGLIPDIFELPEVIDDDIYADTVKTTTTEDDDN